MTAATELVDGRPRRSPRIHIGPAVLHGARTAHLVRDRGSGRFFEIGAKERFIIERLDGTHTLREVGDAYLAEFDRRIPDDDWASILGTLWRKGFLDAPGAPVQAGSDRGRDPERRGLVGLSATARLGDPQRLLDRMAPYTRWLFHPAVTVAVAVGCLAMVVYLAAHLTQLWSQARTIVHHPDLVFVMVILVWVSSILHELGHGLWTHHYGGRATEIGFRWRAPLVLFYCEADDVLVFGSRYQRVATAAVGTVVNLVFLVPFFVLWLALPAGDVTHDAIAALLLSGAARGLLNYLPLFRLDGYMMLSHALNVTDLGPQTWTFLRRWVRRDAAEYPPRARRVYLGYAAVFVAGNGALAAAVVAGIIAWLGGAPRWIALAAFVVCVAMGVVANTVKRRTTGRVPSPAQVSPSAPPAPSEDTEPTPSGAGDEVPARRPASSGVSSGVRRATVDDDDPVLIAHEIRKTYGEKVAVAGTSLAVGKGELFGLLGPNGAGKTTLVEILEGQREPDAGTVSLFGRSPWPRDVDLYRRIGIQTQTSAFFPELTALEHLQAIAGLYRLAASRAARALEMAGLEDSAHVRVDKLSGGQRQRLAVASALVHEPELVFLDEPTGALDPRARRELWRLLRTIQAAGCSIVCTTHHLDEAEALCDRVAIIQSGALLALDAPKQLISASGGATRISFPPVELPADVAGRLAEVAEIRERDHVVDVLTGSPSKALALLADVVDFNDIETRRPTLEDVYLSLTGTEYTQ